jgi:hypothetical protein
VLLLATEKLYSRAASGSTPLPIVVEPAHPHVGRRRRRPRTGRSDAVSARQTRGVYLSSRGGAPGSYRHIGMKDADITCLEVQRDAGQLFLWAALAAEKASEGSGCMRWGVRATEDAPSEWVAFANGWKGGSCHALAFVGDMVHAATHHAGVLSISSSATGATWSAVDVNCGLPLRDVSRLHPVETVAADGLSGVLLAAGALGVHRRGNRRATSSRSRRRSREKVTLPGDWLLCSGPHQLDVASALDDEG